MTAFRSSSWAGLPRFLYNHNPFYLISALLVLYGIYRAMPADSNVGGGWLLLGLLCGYTVVLALAGFVIIRFGQVWNDARTILLTLVLLFVALSTVFDQIVLDSPAAGSRLLLLGLAFAVAVSEGVLRSLRLVLALRYRGPYYLMLVLLFCYPMLLGELSKMGEDGRMPLFVALFPVAAGLALMTLFPAARIGNKRQLPQGHPWRWPAYPWSLFIVLLVAMALRAYSFSLGFESGQFRQSSFQPFFLLPLLFAAAILFLEIGISANNRVACNLALAAPVGLLFLALPGCAPNLVAAKFLAEISDAIGSPIQMTAAALAAFYAIAWVRRLPLGEIGFVACLTILAVVNYRTINLDTSSPPHWLPLGTIALVEFATGLWFRTSWRGMLAVSFGMGSISCLDWIGNTSSYLPFEPWTLAALAVMLLGVACDDAWARFMRRGAWPLIPLVGAIVACNGAASHANAPRWAQATYLACLTVLALLCWYREPALRRFTGATIALAVLASTLSRWLYLDLEESRLADGLPWLAWGSGALGLALLVSFAKAGHVAAAIHRLRLFGRDPTALARIAHTNPSNHSP